MGRNGGDQVDILRDPQVCDRCGINIGTIGTPAYQVRAGYQDRMADLNYVEIDIGYYCADCLAEGV
jgi:hypothetical protein